MTDIKGLESLFNKFDSMDDSITKIIAQTVAVETKAIQGLAKLNVPVNHGELRDSIKTELSQNKDIIQGLVYTNKEYAPYVEFGTGPVGQANHQGISPNVQVSYSQKGWAFLATDIPAADAQKYKWPVKQYKGLDYYVTSGQRAQPFMYPALKNYESTALKNITEKVNKFLKGYRKK